MNNPMNNDPSPEHADPISTDTKTQKTTADTWQLNAITEALGDLTLTIDDSLSIGRGSDNDVVLGSKEISRNHAVLSVLNGKLYLKDLDSSNGSYINDKRIDSNQSKYVADGDIVGFASFCFTASPAAHTDGDGVASSAYDEAMTEELQDEAATHTAAPVQADATHLDTAHAATSTGTVPTDGAQTLGSSTLDHPVDKEDLDDTPKAAPTADIDTTEAKHPATANLNSERVERAVEDTPHESAPVVDAKKDNTHDVQSDDDIARDDLVKEDLAEDDMSSESGIKPTIVQDAPHHDAYDESHDKQMHHEHTHTDKAQASSEKPKEEVYGSDAENLQAEHHKDETNPHDKTTETELQKESDPDVLRAKEAATAQFSGTANLGNSPDVGTQANNAKVQEQHNPATTAQGQPAKKSSGGWFIWLFIAIIIIGAAIWLFNMGGM